MLNILAGIVACDAGRVLLQLAGEQFAVHSATERQRTAMRRTHMGYVYQFFNLVPTLTVVENVRLPARLNQRQGFESFIHGSKAARHQNDGL